MSETEYYTRLCVRFAWSEKEQEARRERAAAMQSRLLLSIVARSIDSGPDCEARAPRLEPDPGLAVATKTDVGRFSSESEPWRA